MEKGNQANQAERIDEENVETTKQTQVMQKIIKKEEKVAKAQQKKALKESKIQEEKVLKETKVQEEKALKETKAQEKKAQKETKIQEKKNKAEEKKALRESNKHKAAAERQQKKEAAAIKRAEKAQKERPIRYAKPVKAIILGALSVLIIVLGYMAYRAYTYVETVETEETRYSYTLTQEPSYKVQLVPNELYPTEVVGEGGIYLSYLTQAINSNFTTTFEGSESSVVTGAYRIDAELVTYITEDKVKKDIWCKTYPMVPVDNFRYEGDSYTLEEAVSVDYTLYSDFIAALEEATEIMLPAEVRIHLTGNMKITTPYKTFTQPLDMTLIAPVGEQYMQIEKVMPEKVEEHVQEKVSTVVPKTYTAFSLYCVLIILAISALILSYRFIGDLTDEEKYTKQIGAIFTEHGARIISVASVDTSPYAIGYSLQTIDDLIKVADELEKPVIHCKGDEALPTHTFYVLEQETLYQFVRQFEGAAREVACDTPQPLERVTESL